MKKVLNFSVHFVKVFVFDVVPLIFNFLLLKKYVVRTGLVKFVLILRQEVVVTCLNICQALYD